MPDQGEPDSKRMRLRYAGVCRICEAELPARTEAVYERSSRTVRCLEHDASSAATVEPGVPGASARRQFERRRRAREDRIRAKHPKLGGLILKVADAPQSTTAWDTGAQGEERLGHRLNELAGDSLLVLHDRRVPKSRANIDHLAIAPTGVFVIDAKKYKGRPHLKVEGGVLRPRVEKLMVGSRDRTTLVDGVLKQLQVVHDIVGPAIPVRGVLCFVDADWPLIGGSLSTRGVDAVRPKKLYQRLAAPGPLSIATLNEMHRVLAGALPPA